MKSMDNRPDLHCEPVLSIGKGKGLAPKAVSAEKAVSSTTGITCRQETADNYQSVAACLNSTWRIIRCRDDIQWILQRRKNGGAERPWRAVAYCCTLKALFRLCASCCGLSEPELGTLEARLLDFLADKGECVGSPVSSLVRKDRHGNE